MQQVILSLRLLAGAEPGLDVRHSGRLLEEPRATAPFTKLSKHLSLPWQKRHIVALSAVSASAACGSCRLPLLMLPCKPPALLS